MSLSLKINKFLSNVTFNAFTKVATAVLIAANIMSVVFLIYSIFMINSTLKSFGL